MVRMRQTGNALIGPATGRGSAAPPQKQAEVLPVKLARAGGRFLPGARPLPHRKGVWGAPPYKGSPGQAGAEAARRAESRFKK